MKKYIIRKQDCGHYSIFKVIDITDFESKVQFKMWMNSIYSRKANWDIYVKEIAHLETFSDVLVLLNCGVMGDGIYR